MSRTVRFPAGISDEALSAALATLGLVLDMDESGFDTRDMGPINNAIPASTPTMYRCATPGCAKAPVVRLGIYSYCATHGRRAMEER